MRPIEVYEIRYFGDDGVAHNLLIHFDRFRRRDRNQPGLMIPVLKIDDHRVKLFQVNHSTEYKDEER